MNESAAPPLVLVHGAWGGGWVWKATARLLRARGYDVYAPTLTGLAERSHVKPHDVTLASHIADVSGLLVYEDLRNAVLVGHSYGGLVITGAADLQPDRVAGLLYFDAFVPASGQSMWDLVPPDFAMSQRAAAQAYDGGQSLPRWSSSAKASGRRDDPRNTPQPVATMSQPWVSVRCTQTWPDRHYVFCSDNPSSVFATTAAAVQNDPAWSYEELAAAHDVIVQHPDQADAVIATQVSRWRTMWAADRDKSAP